MLPLQPHRTRIPVKDVVQDVQEKPSENSSLDKDVQDLEDAADKEEQHQMQENEKDLQDELEMLVTQELAAKTMDDVSRQVFEEEKRIIASLKKAAQATSENADESSFVYLGGKIPIDASTLPNVDLSIDPNMPALEDASDTLPNDGIFNGAYDDDKDVGKNPRLYHKPYKIESEVDAMQVSGIVQLNTEGLVFVDFAIWEKEIGTKWVFRNKRDESNAFLYGNIEKRPVLVHQPPGFVRSTHPNKSISDQSSLRSNHDSRAWYETLSTFLLENGFKREVYVYRVRRIECMPTKTIPDEFHGVADILSKFDFYPSEQSTTPIGLTKPLNQMMDYGFNFINTKIHIDNESTISVIKNLVSHSRTKHIEIRFHFIRDCYEKRLIEVIKIHTDHNVADLLTKGFDVTRISMDWRMDRSCAANSTHIWSSNTITEASVRSKLQLADATGIHNLSDAEIYAGLATLGPKSGGWDQFGSTVATALICLCGILYHSLACYVGRCKPMDQGERIAQPAEPHPTPATTSRSAECQFTLKELMVLVPSLVTRVTSLEKELKETKQTLRNDVLKLVKKRNVPEGKVTDFVTPTKASGEAQKEEISPTILEAAKTLSKVASQSVSKAKSTDKGNRYRRRARSMAKKINTRLDAEDEINTVDTGRREGKAQMVEEDIQATHKTKEQIRQEEAGLEEAIRLQAQMDEEVVKQIHLDKMLAKRVQEEQELSEQQLKRKVEVQKAAQFYTEEDWDTIRGKDEVVKEEETEVSVKKTGMRRKQKARKGINIDMDCPKMSSTGKRRYVKDKVKDGSLSELEIRVDAIQLTNKTPTIVNLEDHFLIQVKGCLSDHKKRWF
ncbi:hypothetical protein Tco_0758383 [Tanacetum coccineum]